MTSGLANLARNVRERRTALGLTQLEVAARGGPSNTTLTKIENGEQPPPLASTLKKLDVGLDWVAGSANAVLQGGSPLTLERDAADSSPAAPLAVPDREAPAPTARTRMSQLLALSDEFASKSLPDDYLTDVERAVDLLISAIGHFAAGHDDIGSTTAREADQLVNWWRRRRAPFDADLPTWLPGWQYDLRLARAQYEFGVLRSLLDPPPDGGGSGLPVDDARPFKLAPGLQPQVPAISILERPDAEDPTHPDGWTRQADEAEAARSVLEIQAVNIERQGDLDERLDELVRYWQRGQELYKQRGRRFFDFRAAKESFRGLRDFIREDPAHRFPRLIALYGESIIEPFLIFSEMLANLDFTVGVPKIIFGPRKFRDA